MRRRTVLVGLTALLPSALAGCTGGAGSGTETATETPPDETVTPRLVTASLLPREACPDPGGATVRFGEGDAITVRGCVVGKNGCTVPRLQDVRYDADATALTVVVAAVEERAENEACTEALVNLGYEVDVEVQGATPTRVRVVHDDVDGRRTVADATR
ncbi:MAG: hypothetical protein ABEK02_01155 [Haloquadratum sp.]